MNNGMQLLPPNTYGNIVEQLAAIPYNTLFARAVLELKADGTVWGDNQDTPTTVLIAHAYGMSLLIGATENEAFNSSLADYLINTSRKRAKCEWLQVYPEAWHDKLSELTQEKIIQHATIANAPAPQDHAALIEKYRKTHVLEWTRVNFKYNDNNQTLNSEPSYTIKPITTAIWDQIAGSVIPKYFWKSKEEFNANGIGYALMNGDDVVSIAFSSCKTNNELEIGVETAEAYRGMGYARQVCQKLLADCRKYNYTPLWACKKENTGSYRLAKSLGFEESLTLPYYELLHQPPIPAAAEVLR